jgi:hypothetical protein
MSSQSSYTNLTTPHQSMLFILHHQLGLPHHTTHHHQSKAIKKNLLTTLHLLKSQLTNLLHLLSQHTSLQHQLNQLTNHLHLLSQLTNLRLQPSPSTNHHPHLRHHTSHHHQSHQDRVMLQGLDLVMDLLLNPSQAMDLLPRQNQVTDLQKNPNLPMALLSNNTDPQNNNTDQPSQDQANSREDHRITMVHQSSSTMLHLPSILHLSPSLQRSLYIKSPSPATLHQSQVMVQSKLQKLRHPTRHLQSPATLPQLPSQAILPLL